MERQPGVGSQPPAKLGFRNTAGAEGHRPWLLCWKRQSVCPSTCTLLDSSPRSVPASSLLHIAPSPDLAPKASSVAAWFPSAAPPPGPVTSRNSLRSPGFSALAENGHTQCAPCLGSGFLLCPRGLGLARPMGWVPAWLVLMRRGGTERRPVPPPPRRGTPRASATSSLCLFSCLALPPPQYPHCRMYRTKLGLQTTEPHRLWAVPRLPHPSTLLTGTDRSATPRESQRPGPRGVLVLCTCQWGTV